ncbi:MAG TPA: VOC family protein [Phycisphaerales bacterium]|nr:VOC family protein [Phycisphaerales bacterium]
MPTKHQQVSGIGGVFFRSKDPAKLAAWYKKRLGFAVEDGWHGCIFNWRDYKNPKNAGSTIWSPFKADTKYFGSPKQAAMINYRVSDLKKMLAQLKRAGVWIDPKTQDSEYGKFAWVKDSEGNRIELWEPPRESAAKKPAANKKKKSAASKSPRKR